MTAKERKLHELFKALDEADQGTVLAFVEFLVQRQPAKEGSMPQPALESRPENESVVAAIKRLSRSYPMLDKSKMLNATSALMTQHVVQGRPAPEVIDELESLFAQHYDQFRQVHDQ
jgi:hypothetical protein